MRSLLIYLLLSLSLVATAKANQLENHPSPYIRMHAHDKVHWQLWSEKVMAQARQQHRLVFVSIGYFSCHWCHVMRNESFNDTAIAKKLNSQFISVKVDRELNPSLDEYLMNFVQKTRGHGGWPLNVFITPDGYPLVGMVYLPKEKFLALLEKLSSKWQADPASLTQLAQQAFLQNKPESPGKPISFNANAVKLEVIEQTKQFADDLLGGFGAQAKFPSGEYLRLLINITDAKQTWLNEFLQLSLAQMAELGLHDVIGGGFFRYTTDPDWHTPHFEKMLYTNASMIRVYTAAAARLKRPGYLNIANETVAFIRRDMHAKSGGYISALSAQDNRGMEGGSYLWQLEELKRQLSPGEWQQVQQQWQLLQQESGEYLPAGLAVAPQWHQLRNKLMIKRLQHPAGVDDKVLPSWNGYLLQALAELYGQQPNPTLKSMGDELAGYLQKIAKGGLTRDMGNGRHHFLEDFAMVAAGLDAWSEQSGWRMPPQLVQKLVKQAFQHFYVEPGWKLSDQTILPRPSQPARLSVSHLPAADVVLLRLRRKWQLNEQIPVTTAVTGLRQSMLDNPFSWPGRISLYLEQNGGNIPTYPQSRAEIR